MKKFFYLSMVGLTSLTLLATCSSSTSTSTSTSEASTTTSDSSTVESSSATTYKVGDTIVFDGEAEITITGVEWTDERNQLDDTNPERVLKVTYNVNNLSDEDYYVGSGIELYVNGQKMGTYPNTNTMDTISARRSYEGAVQHFGVIGTGSMELEVEPSMSFTNVKPAIVSLDIQ